MLQRQIIKGLGNQIDIEDPIYMKHAITGFHYIVWMLISSIIVTIYRTVPLQACTLQCQFFIIFHLTPSIVNVAEIIRNQGLAQTLQKTQR
jgi:hypothetical protein